MRAAQHAPRDPFRVLECCHGLAEIVECGVWVVVERPRVKQPHLERDIIALAENAPHHGHRLAKQ